MRTAYELSDWQGYLTHNEIDEIQKCVRELFVQYRPIAVNIGAGGGTSTIAMLEQDSRIVVFSIDIAAAGQETVTNEHLRLDECGPEYVGRVKRIWGDSKMVGKNWPVKVDLVFVDGDHTLEGCAGDIEAWADHIRSGGYMLFHDYGSPNWPGVAQAVDSMMGVYEELGAVQKIKLVDSLMVYKIL